MHQLGTIICATLFLTVLFGSAPIHAEQVLAAGDLRLAWEVKNRFRLFRMESDFKRHVAAHAESILAAEQRLALGSEGRGWARLMFNNLCVDAAGRPHEPCERDGVQESYLAPSDHRVGIRLADTVPQTASCTLNLDSGDGAPQRLEMRCSDEAQVRVRQGRPTVATMEVATPDGNVRIATSEIRVRDFLIAGLGDSIASGEGNPDRPISLADEGFCFQQFLSGSTHTYFRPSRAGFKGNKACEFGPRSAASDTRDWTQLGARWKNQACHRSLYSYQVRAALALAIENPHIAVTFLPLACTGAKIDAGLFGTQRAREINCGTSSCPSTVPAQIPQLQELLAAAKKRDPSRRLDLVLLTIGANDIEFSGLVANVMIEQATERVLFQRGGVIATVENAESVLQTKLPRDFTKLRSALKPLVGGDLARVVYVSYGHPALAADGNACPGGRDGFDIHPAFGLDPQRMRRVADFVRDRFLPRLKDLATCGGGIICQHGDIMTFVDGHQPAFLGRGLCARSDSDPDFDRACFKSDGTSFTTSVAEAPMEPLTCGRSVKEFRSYAPRARWIRTANDSYFAAMTYPEGISSALQPSDIHDATWGVLSAVYGGAVHPTAEGHAAMADAALSDMRRVLNLSPRKGSIIVTPLAAPVPLAQ